MEWLKDLLQPQVLGPLTGIVAVIGSLAFAAYRAYLRHQERIEKIRNGIDPDANPGRQ